MPSEPRGCGIRSIAWVSLLVVAVHLSYGVSPLMVSHCACAHGVEVPCDCPHHLGATDSGSPPCHIHAKSRRAREAASPQPCIRARCGTIPPDLILIGLISTSEAPQLPSPEGPSETREIAPLRLPEVFHLPLKPPPKANA